MNTTTATNCCCSPKRDSVQAIDDICRHDIQECTSVCFLEEEEDDCFDCTTIGDSGRSSKSTVSVSFREQDEIWIVPGIDDYTDEEFDNIYYSPDEQEELVEDARDAAEGWTFGTDEDTKRGLEAFTEMGRQLIRKNRTAVIQAVLKAQQKLKQQNRSQHLRRTDLLAQISRGLTADSQDSAYQMGYKDELASLPRQRKAHCCSYETTRPHLFTRMLHSLCNSTPNHQ